MLRQRALARLPLLGWEVFVIIPARSGRGGIARLAAAWGGGGVGIVVVRPCFPSSRETVCFRAVSMTTWTGVLLTKKAVHCSFPGQSGSRSRPSSRYPPPLSPWRPAEEGEEVCYC